MTALHRKPSLRVRRGGAVASGLSGELLREIEPERRHRRGRETRLPMPIKRLAEGDDVERDRDVSGAS